MRSALDGKRPGMLLLAGFLALVVAGCGGEDNGLFGTTTSSVAPATTAAPATSTMPPSTTVATTQPAPATTTTAPPSSGVLISLPVGPGGIAYQGGATDMERSGPSLITVADDGGIHIVDPVALEILSFHEGRMSTIELGPRDVLAVTALAAATDHLVVVEVFFAPERQRVHRIGFDGTVMETVNLPSGVRLEDGLSGVLTGPSDEIIIELRGGEAYGLWNGAAVEVVTELQIGSRRVVSRSPDLGIDDWLVAANLTGEFGAVRYLGTAVDGTHVVIREDVIRTSPMIEVLSTAEWYSGDGEFLGSGLIPLDGQAIDTPPGVALAPDGRVFLLKAREHAVEISIVERVADRITTLTP